MDRKNTSDKINVSHDNTILHLEENPKLANGHVLKSSLDDLGLLATAKRFKKVRYLNNLVKLMRY
jgi:hypothetical protein